MLKITFFFHLLDHSSFPESSAWFSTALLPDAIDVHVILITLYFQALQFYYCSKRPPYKALVFTTHMTIEKTRVSSGIFL